MDERELFAEALRGGRRQACAVFLISGIWFATENVARYRSRIACGATFPRRAYTPIASSAALLSSFCFSALTSERFDNGPSSLTYSFARAIKSRPKRTSCAVVKASADAWFFRNVASSSLPLFVMSASAALNSAAESVTPFNAPPTAIAGFGMFARASFRPPVAPVNSAICVFVRPPVFISRDS